MSNRWRVAVAILGAALSLAGCGGGGGSSGDDLEITLSQSRVSTTAEQGQPGSMGLTATVSGSYDGDIFFAAQASTDAIASIDVTFSGTQAQIVATTSTALEPGEHSGQLTVTVCADRACAKPIGGSPYNVPYEVEVTPGFLALPATVEAGFVSGTELPQHRIGIQLPQGIAGFTAQAEQDWLEVLDVSASGFTVKPRVGLSSGSYSTRVMVTAGDRTLWVPVEYSVTAPPAGEHDLLLAFNSVTMTATEGGVSAPFNLDYTAPTWDASVSAEVLYEGGISGWLHVNSVDGRLELQADAQALAQGRYTAVLQVRSVGRQASATVSSVPVALSVGPGLVRPADQNINVEGSTPLATLSRTVRIDMVNGPARDWTATSDSSWLTLDTPQGRTGGDLGFHIDPDRLATLANAESHTAIVTVTALPANIAPVRFQVLVFKNLPQVRFVATPAQPSGRSSTMVLRGTGLNSVGSAGSQLRIESTSDYQVSVRNDREIRLTFGPSVPAGSHEVLVTNALGIAVPTKRVDLFSPKAYSYFRTHLYGHKRGLLFDPVGEIVYFTNDILGNVLWAWRFDGTEWYLTERTVPGLTDIALSPDAATLIAASTDGTVHRLDTLGLTIQSTHVVPGGIMQTEGLTGLAVTNDGKVWLTASGSANWGRPYTFDLQTSTLSAVETTGLSTSFHYGPWSHASRDGERLVMSQTQSISPPPPMLYWDARAGVLRETPASLTHFRMVTQSEDGGRLMLHAKEVYDTDFGLVGLAPDLEEGRVAAAASLSPDGRRAYVVTYHESHEETPRIYVLDSSQPVPAGSRLPLLGSFDLPDHFCFGSGIDFCPGNTITGVSPDGRTLFLAGHTALIAAPIPTAHQSALGKLPARRSQVRRVTAPATVPPRPWAR